MTIRYDLRPDRVDVRITDVLDANEIMAFYDALAADPAFRRGTPFLVDVRRVESTAPLRELQATALASRRAIIFSVPTRSAVLVSSHWMREVVAEWARTSGATHVDTRPFDTEAEAAAWLAG